MDGADARGASFKDARFTDADLTGLSGWQEADFAGACISERTLLPSGLHLPECK
jgi:uncharacterized protein YjbI with pentapeptide repeats